MQLVTLHWHSIGNFIDHVYDVICYMCGLLFVAGGNQLDGVGTTYPTRVGTA